MYAYRKSAILLAPIFLCAAQSASAQTSAQPTNIIAADQAAASDAPARDGALDRIWKLPTIYKSDQGGGLDELRIVGRLHIDNYVLESDIGDDSDLVVRRARIGLRAKLFERLEAQVQGDLNLEGGGPLYSRLTDAYLAWTFSDAAKLTIGKQSTEFTLDGAVSSNRLLTIDRGNISQNFGIPEEYLPGVTLGGKAGRWSYKAGAYSAGRNNGEFGDFSGGVALVGSLGYDVGSLLAVRTATVRLDYLHDDANPANNFLRNFAHVGSLNLTLDDGNWGLSAEAVLADGALGQSDGHGFSAMPWISLGKKIQLVARFTHLKSDEVNGLRFSRYESVASSRRGDRYDEVYAGANWLIHGHNLKLQTGLTYANMRDRANDGGRYDGITWVTALRLSW